jgi:hypothetical protein|tara:strand:- start:25 stop:261 length:237 start_codon:yes stop_codon:yes gene_type:complete
MRVNHCSPQVQLSAVCASILSLAYFANPTLAAMQKMSERALSCHSLRHVHVFYVEGPLFLELKSDFARAAKVSNPPDV